MVYFFGDFGDMYWFEFICIWVRGFGIVVFSGYCVWVDVLFCGGVGFEFFDCIVCSFDGCKV